MDSASCPHPSVLSVILTEVQPFIIIYINGREWITERTEGWGQDYHEAKD